MTKQICDRCKSDITDTDRKHAELNVKVKSAMTSNIEFKRDLCDICLYALEKWISNGIQ